MVVKFDIPRRLWYQEGSRPIGRPSGRGRMDRRTTRPRQRAVLQLVCVGLLACSWAGCATTGGGPWDVLFPSRLFKGQEGGPEDASPEGLASHQGSAPDAHPDAMGVAREDESPWAGARPSPSWPFLDELESSWQTALLRQPLLASQDAFGRFAMGPPAAAAPRVMRSSRRRHPRGTASRRRGTPRPAWP